MRAMGLDVGDKTIGVSISDPLGIIAQGIKTISIGEDNSGLEEIDSLVKQYSITAIVVGLPKNMNGSIGPQGEKVLKFVELLKTIFNREIVLWDERLTTVAATKMLIEGNVRRENRKKVVDKIAASYILQGYLDRKSL
jgi:putative holliday junction resolvase